MRATVPTLVACSILATVLQAGESANLFRERVAPLLSARCASCHNTADARGGFSLQTAAELDASGFVVAGQPTESHLLSVILPQLGQRPSMPKSGAPLSEAEQSVIRQWIASGAEWPEGTNIEVTLSSTTDWWSFAPLVQPKVPVSANVTGSSATMAMPAHPVDAFITQELVQRGLTPSRAAEPRELIRRLFYDLIGLPPTPTEVAGFEQQCQQVGFDTAWGELVDRLLASPRYGERWAQHWLDVVKYADTSGYDKDKLRPNAWPYRDYVIRSFNEDKPYAQFVQEQIAGDVLFPGNPAGILGLGFLAAGPWDWIGHAEVAESKIDGKIARHLDRDEMVSNTLNTFCSLTIQCCQCHDHKFDPFTQEHYYNLQSVFAAIDRAERAYDLDPKIEQQRLAWASEIQQLRSAEVALRAAIIADGGPELAALEQLIAELTPHSASADVPAAYGYHSGLTQDQFQSKWIEIDLGSEIEITAIVLRPCYDDFNNIGAGFGFPLQFTISGRSDGGDEQLLHAANTTDVPAPGLTPYEVQLSDTRARHIRVVASKLANRKDDFNFALAEVQVVDAQGNNVALRATVTAFDSIESPTRWSRANLTDGLWPQDKDPNASRRLVEARRARKAILDRVTTDARVAEGQRLAQQIATLEESLKRLPTGKLVYAASTHFKPQGTFAPTNGIPRLIHRLERGDILQPRELSEPGALPPLPGMAVTAKAAIPALAVTDAQGRFSMPDELTAGGQAEGFRRAALALWLTRLDQPLTWRSIVNRVWQHHFGSGIVRSPNDFGRMGESPSHPELLDWLAADFRDHGQSFKRLHKLIVTSATYCQSSQDNPDLTAIDADNRWLWRMNRRRLSAEEVRDSMLATSDILDLKMGGPGYYLFVLERPEHSPHFEYHKFDHDDPASYRRSIYRFIVRSQPDPYMNTLDCADSSQSTPQRNETLTALQALSMLNNGFALKMAEQLAGRLERDQASLEEQVAWAFCALTGRQPDSSEVSELTTYAREHGLPNLCRMLFNLSEFVYVD